MTPLSFAHLNLRWNPFGEVPWQERADLAIVDVEDLVRGLSRSHFAVQFLGEKGYGKTTHLLALLRRFPNAAYVHVGEGQRLRIPRGEPLLIDEIQRLPPRRRRRIFRRSGPLAVGTHEDMRAELSQVGYDVESVEVARSLDASRLCAILNRRVAWSRRGAGPIPQVTLATARALLDEFGDDVRSIEGHMYNKFQRLQEVRHV